MTVFQPSDTVKNLKTGLGAVGSTQIANVERVYPTEPVGPPENHSLVVGSPTFRVLDDTNAKMLIEWTFPVSYCCQINTENEDVDEVESYFLPLLLAYSSWANQNLSDDAFITSVDRGGVIQASYSGLIVRAIRILVKLTTEHNIPVS